MSFLSKLRHAAEKEEQATTALSIGGSLERGGSIEDDSCGSTSFKNHPWYVSSSSPLDISAAPKRKHWSTHQLPKGSVSLEESEIVLALGSSPNTALGLGQADSSSPPNVAARSFDYSSGGMLAPCRNFGSLRLALSSSCSGDTHSATRLECSQNDGNEMGLGLTTHNQPMVVDEGSSSARWMKSGGLMPALLQQQQQQQQDRSESEDNCYSDDLDEGALPLCNSAPTSDKLLLKVCKFEGGCARGARGASGLCIAHGGGRRCQKEGCTKGAEGRTVYCKAHGGGRRCHYLGCTKSAEGKTDYCISHGGGRRCSYENCAKAARGRSGLCIRHGGGKRCQKEGCTKSAEGFSGLCISHGGGRRCQAPECTKGAQGSTMFCKAHGGGKRCMVEGCGKGAEGSTPRCKAHGGGKRCMYGGGGCCSKSVHGGTLFCVAHGGGKRCAIQGCSKSARGRTAFCVKHGGGKRCQVEACGKSAQGSTDFCKAHGGGKRCIWGQQGSPYGASQVLTCDRFARGRLGLCAAHTSQVQEQQNSISISGSVVEQYKFWASSSSSSSGPWQGGGNGVYSLGFSLIPSQTPGKSPDEPEGRVHGGGLLALLSQGKR